MQIVIEVSEEEYNNGTLIRSFGCYSKKLDEVIYSGTPLPKHHGRLKDIDAFISKVEADRAHSAYTRSWTADDVLSALDNTYSPTIIEADN